MTEFPIELKEPVHGFRASGCALPQDGSALVIICPFPLRPPTDKGPLYNRTLKRLHAFWYDRVLYAANPRPPAYQTGYVAAFLQRQKLRADVLILHTEAKDAYPEIPRVKYFAADALRVEEAMELSEKYDHTILSYADPLGLGHSSFEKTLLKSAAVNTYILNGRGRVFPLTARIHRLLRQRRFMARTRLAECALGAAILPLSCILALYDAVRKKFERRHV